MTLKTMTLKIDQDLTTTYLPRKGEIEALVSDKAINHPIYYYRVDESNHRLEIIYRKEMKRLHGMPLYHLKYFVVQDHYFDLGGFKAFYKACFPTNHLKNLTKDEARELCNAFYQQFALKQQQSGR